MPGDLLSLKRSLQPHGLYSPWNSPGQDTGVGSLSLLQGVFPTQGSNSGLLHCRWILYQLSRKGSPRILDWVAYPFSRGSFQPRNRTRVSYIAGGFFTSWAIRESHWAIRESLIRIYFMQTICTFLKSWFSMKSLCPFKTFISPYIIQGTWKSKKDPLSQKKNDIV